MERCGMLFCVRAYVHVCTCVSVCACLYLWEYLCRSECICVHVYRCQRSALGVVPHIGYLPCVLRQGLELEVEARLASQ